MSLIVLKMIRRSHALIILLVYARQYSVAFYCNQASLYKSCKNTVRRTLPSLTDISYTLVVNSTRRGWRGYIFTLAGVNMAACSCVVLESSRDMPERAVRYGRVNKCSRSVHRVLINWRLDEPPPPPPASPLKCTFALLRWSRQIGWTSLMEVKQSGRLPCKYVLVPCLLATS